MVFQGYRRPDGKVGIRNHVLILPTCACASESCRLAAAQVKGAVNVIINTGCSDVAANTEMTQRVLRGFACNGNIYGIVIIGLGCETVPHRELKAELEKMTSKPVVSFGIQEVGGTVKTDVYKRQHGHHAGSEYPQAGRRWPGSFELYKRPGIRGRKGPPTD